MTGTCTHQGMVPSASGEQPQPIPGLPFDGVIDAGVSANVRVLGQGAATQGSMASNSPAHMPTPPATRFVAPPSNKAIIESGSGTVRINGKQAARQGDTAKTCTEVPSPGSVTASGSVRIGG